ncbi:hypothetical protein Z517_02167 [Fonsecaea pedrosoi CBS 271.37]|uniref:Transcription factor domain-containing protein n=1 Tax=Fonsecaea pedrosoi CBS 271.37 TaxID=1442368 RepID=A0A0D2HEP8_9EURO|nr:uncharacterized protein Z517_02167 [Fonsecaea pedrosoi CBS 271.37]KIW82924.1 hypothetical protein Z517_02167 [Fonsecaea pedrosoi CBS 271.37]
MQPYMPHAARQMRRTQANLRQLREEESAMLADTTSRYNDARGSSIGTNTAVNSRVTSPFLGPSTIDKAEAVTTPASFGPVLAQYLSEQSFSYDSFQTSHHGVSRDLDHHGDESRQRRTSNTASPSLSRQGGRHAGLFSPSRQDRDSSHSSPQTSPLTVSDSVPINGHPASIPRSPSGLYPWHGQLSGLGHSAVSDRRSTKSVTKSSPPFEEVGSNIPLYLTEMDLFVLRHFVERVAGWIDAFSSENPYSTIVPIFALECPAVLFSCLAIAGKQLALTRAGAEAQITEDVAVEYYQKALKAFSTLLMEADSAYSDKILASSIMLSGYEMLDMMGESFSSHLRGIASLLQLWRVNGDSPGIKGSVFWTWFRSDSWAALHAGRRMFLDESYWEPRAVDSFEDLSHVEIANRALFLLGQCVSFCSGVQCRDNVEGLEEMSTRQRKRDKIRSDLERWKGMLPPAMTRFYVSLAQQEEQDEDYTAHPHARDISSIWYVYPHCAVGIQMYHACQILLALSGLPSSSRRQGQGHGHGQGQGIFTATAESLSVRRLINRSREQILLIANSGTTDPFSFTSTQCLYIAGLVTEGVQERRRTIELLEECQRQSGRRTVQIADELRAVWAEEW